MLLTKVHDVIGGGGCWVQTQSPANPFFPLLMTVPLVIWSPPCHCCYLAVMLLCILLRLPLSDFTSGLEVYHFFSNLRSYILASPTRWWKKSN